MTVHVAIPLFPRFTALDAVGPYEVLQRIPSVQVTFLAARPGVLRSENDMLGMVADASFDDLVDPDVVVFPGGVGTRAVQRDEPTLDWVRRAHATTRYTTSVCTGSLVLGSAGLLRGLTATTHWSCASELEPLGAVPVAQRVVEHLDRRIITAAGVSSGIDMALRLVELPVDRTAAQAAQLMVEYDPQLPTTVARWPRSTTPSSRGSSSTQNTASREPPIVADRRRNAGATGVLQ